MNSLYITIRCLGDHSILGYIATAFLFDGESAHEVLRGKHIIIQADEIIASKESLKSQIDWLDRHGASSITWVKGIPDPTL